MNKLEVTEENTSEAQSKIPKTDDPVREINANLESGTSYSEKCAEETLLTNKENMTDKSEVDNNVEKISPTEDPPFSIVIKFKDESMTKYYKPRFLNFFYSFAELEIKSHDELSINLAHDDSLSLQEWEMIQENLALARAAKSTLTTQVTTLDDPANSNKKKRRKRKKRKKPSEAEIELFVVDATPSTQTQSASGLHYTSKYVITTEQTEQAAARQRFIRQKKSSRYYLGEHHSHLVPDNDHSELVMFDIDGNSIQAVEIDKGEFENRKSDDDKSDEDTEEGDKNNEDAEDRKVDEAEIGKSTCFETPIVKSVSPYATLPNPENSLADFEEHKQKVLEELDEEPTKSEEDDKHNQNSENKKVDEAGTVKSSCPGTPILKSVSPYVRLPNSENFSKDVSPVINFENLPNSTGKYEQMTDVLQKVRSAMKKNQNGN